VRFFIGMSTPLLMPATYFGTTYYSNPDISDNGYSHPWLWDQSSNTPYVDGNWLNNLQSFFADATGNGLSAVLTLSFTPASGFLASTISECTGQKGLLKFLPWLPYGHTAAGDEDCKDINDAYKTWAAANPYFQKWGGWGPFQSLFSSIVLRARQTNIQINEVDIEQERNLVSYTVEARLIYDNISSFDVLGYIRSALQGQSYNSTVATFSTIPQFPDADTGFNNANLIDCGSIYGDSAMLFNTSSLLGAIGGAANGGLFGWPMNQGVIHNMLCNQPGITSTGGMESLPPGVGYSAPSVVDVHAYPCITFTGEYTTCNNSLDPTNTAETFYSDVWSLMTYRGVASGLASFGESSFIDYNCDPGGLPPSDTGAQWAVNGYKISSLYSNHAAGTAFLPFNNVENSCYSNPINISGSAYNPFN